MKPAYITQASAITDLEKDLKISSLEALVCPECNRERIKKNGTCRTGVKKYQCQDCGRQFRLEYKRKFIPSNHPLAEYEKDIWDLRNLGISPPPGERRYTLNFQTILLPWLKDATKQFIRHTLTTLTYSSALDRLTNIKEFGKFLATHHLGIEATELNRQLIVEYLGWTLSKGLANHTRGRRLSTLRTFFELCRRFGWSNIPAIPLIYPEDFPKDNKLAPRYIPQEVVEQLNRYLSDLPEPIMRMVLVIQECGMRVSELCLLEFDCIRQDAQGDWWLNYHQFKMKKDHTISITKELASVIQEQQKYIKENIGENYKYLFCSRKANRGKKAVSFLPKAEPMDNKSFAKALKKLAKGKNICTLAGEPWDFETHQFRHTVGTTMINNGVPQHIVQRYLGHESSEMTSRYAHIHDQTLKTEITKFHGKVVNVAGQVVESAYPELDTADLQWFKRNVQAQALPNGSCSRPVIKGPCPHEDSLPNLRRLSHNS